jgi:hypothetical protein
MSSSTETKIADNNILFVVDAATIAADLNKNDPNISSNVASTVVSTVVNASAIADVVTKAATGDVKPVDATKIDNIVTNVTEAANVVVNIENAVENVVSSAVSAYRSPISTILSICGQACAAINNQQIDKSNVIVMVHALMEAVETFRAIKGLTGDQKKQLVLDCLHWLVNNHCALIELEKQELSILIDHVAPPAIDVIINVANGVSQLVDKIKAKCSCCRIA